MRRPDYDRRVVVTGLGVISPVGNDVATAWSNLVNGVSGLAPITYFDTEPYEAKAKRCDFDAKACGWTPRRSAAASRACTSPPPRSRPSPIPDSN